MFLMKRSVEALAALPLSTPIMVCDPGRDWLPSTKALSLWSNAPHFATGTVLGLSR